MRVQNTDYSGHTVTIGIDVHLKQWNSAVYFENRLYKVFQQDSKAEELKKYLVKHFPGATYQSAYEAGCFGFAIDRQLKTLGIDNIVINASDIPSTDKDKRRKTDKRDAQRIGRSLLNGELVGIFVPSKQQEADRQLVRHRTKTMRKSVTKAQQRVKSYLCVKGIKYYEDFPKTTWSKIFINWLKEIKFEESSDQLVWESLLANLDYVRAERRKIDRQIVLLSREERYADLVKLLRSIPGVGLLSAMVFITEIIAIDRFKSLDKLCSYIGLVPDVSASADTCKVKGITRRSNCEARRILLQCSWVAAGRDPELAKAYYSYKKKMIHQKAIIKIARKLLSRIRAIWKTKQSYKSPYQRDKDKAEQTVQPKEQTVQSQEQTVQKGSKKSTRKKRRSKS